MLSHFNSHRKQVSSASHAGYLGGKHFVAWSSYGLFEGTFVYLQAEGVSSIDAGKPFNPYTPDLLWLLGEGEAVAGGLSNYSASAAAYDGEVVLDSQTATLAYKTAPPAPPPASGDPVYVLAGPLDAVSKYEKIDTRCN